MRTPDQKKESPLESARSQIQQWVNDEQLKKNEWESRGQQGASYDPHSNDIAPALLTDRELTGWMKWRSGTGNIDKFRQERDSAFAALRKETDMATRLSGETLWAYLGNRMSDAVYRELLREEQKEKKGPQ